MSKQFSVEFYPQTQIIGMSKEITMQDSQKECPLLWQAFYPRIIPELANGVTFDQKVKTYGISIMLDENKIVYWAGISVEKYETIPEGMKTMTIPAGEYVKCVVQNLMEIANAYNAMYLDWPKTQSEYEINMAGLGFEAYPMGWNPEQPFEIYGSVKKK